MKAPTSSTEINDQTGEREDVPPYKNGVRITYVGNARVHEIDDLRIIELQRAWRHGEINVFPVDYAMFCRGRA